MVVARLVFTPNPRGDHPLKDNPSEGTTRGKLAFGGRTQIREFLSKGICCPKRGKQKTTLTARESEEGTRATPYIAESKGHHRGGANHLKGSLMLRITLLFGRLPHGARTDGDGRTNNKKPQTTRGLLSALICLEGVPRPN